MRRRYCSGIRRYTPWEHVRMYVCTSTRHNSRNLYGPYICCPYYISMFLSLTEQTARMRVTIYSLTRNSRRKTARHTAARRRRRHRCRRRRAGRAIPDE